MPKSVQGRAQRVDPRMYQSADPKKPLWKPMIQFIFQLPSQVPKSDRLFWKKDKRMAVHLFMTSPDSTHWSHLRTTNPIESTFATPCAFVLSEPKGLWLTDRDFNQWFSKLGIEAQKHWRRLNGFSSAPKKWSPVSNLSMEKQLQETSCLTVIKNKDAPSPPRTTQLLTIISKPKEPCSPTGIQSTTVISVLSFPPGRLWPSALSPQRLTLMKSFLFPQTQMAQPK